MGLFDASFWNMGGGAPGGQSPWGNASFIDVLGPMLQDFGANWQGQQGTQLQKLQKRQQYQQMLPMVLGTEQISPVTVTPSMNATGPGTSASERSAAYNAPAMSYQGGMIGNNPMLQRLAPMLAAADPEIGMPLLLNTALSEGQYERERADKKVTPISDAEAQQLGLRGGGVYGRDGIGNITVIQDSDMKSLGAMGQQKELTRLEQGPQWANIGLARQKMAWDQNQPLAYTPGTVLLDPRTRQPIGQIPLKPEDQIKQQDAILAKKAGLAAQDKLLDSVTRLYNHPGLSGAVGFGWEKTGRGVLSALPFVDAQGYTPGTDRANFKAELDTLKAQGFLPMVQQLKGMGQLSDAEGKRLTDAIGALSEDMSEKEFKASLQRIYADIDAARMRAGGGARKNPFQSGGPSVSNW